MNQDMNSLLHGYLDGVLTSAQETELNDWIKADPQNAATFAGMVRLHDHLRNLTLAQHLIDPVDARKPKRLSLRVIGAVTTIAAALLIALCWNGLAPANAATELNRLIDRASSVSDRSYLIHNKDDQPESINDRRPPINGATLHVRYPDQYVLIRRFPDGRAFIIGSDGEQSWSIPPDGVVRVSADPLRFRGPVPGHQHGIPFVNLRSDLVQLRDAYNLVFLQPNAKGQRGLLAEKKSSAHRGPNQVELWYDPNTGIVQQMVFRGMPQMRGGPRSLSVELQDHKPLDPHFFQHQTHHSSDRRIVEEDGN